MTDFNRLDSNNIQVNKSDVCLLVAVRDNELLLPYFFEHYRKIGVGRFFIVDNMSSDGTIDFLVKQKDTYIFQTDEPYRVEGMRVKENHNKWLNQICKYVYGNWCVVVDSDEFLIYPDYENINVKDLATYLDNEKSSCLKTTNIDMYSKYSVKDTILEIGQNPLEILEYFDFPLNNHHPRLRILPHRKKAGGKLGKISFLKVDSETHIQPGHHNVIPCKPSETVTGGTFHFKLDSSYIPHLIEACERKVYWHQSQFKSRILARFKKNPDLSFYDKEVSIKYIDSKQLVDLGIMAWHGGY